MMLATLLTTLVFSAAPCHTHGVSPFTGPDNACTPAPPSRQEDPMPEWTASVLQERDDLRHALIWALSNVDDPGPYDAEYAEDHGGATRLAWPNNPENWS